MAVCGLERQGGAPYKLRPMAAKRFPILFITASRIGDAVLSSGLLKTLVDEVPEARFTVVGSALTAPLFAATPRLDELIVMDKRPAAGHWLSLWRRVRTRRWGLVVDMRGSAMARLLKPWRRAVRRRGESAEHKVVEAARLLKLEDAPPSPFLFTDEAIESRAEALTRGASPILAMAPFANWVGKAWPAERFALVARQLLGRDGALAGARLMVVGGPEDQMAAEPVRSAVERSRVIDLVGREELLVVYAALKRARLFIGNDSGVAHLAAAAGAPTLGLFGPSDEDLYAPWGSLARTVRGPRTFDEILDIDPELNQQICHMMDLTPQTVLARAEALLEDTVRADA